MKADSTIGKVISYLNRNNQSLANGNKAKKNQVNIEWWSTAVNIGDTLSPVICEYMLKKEGIDINRIQKKTKHLYAVGSVIGRMKFDATIWGSGVLHMSRIRDIIARRKLVKYDIRALRGPFSRDVMKAAGYDVSNCCLGDPGMLMPFVYTPEHVEKKYRYSVIPHHRLEDYKLDTGDHLISVHTDDYKKFITELLETEIVISSSLHGIILAESYGVPAIFLLEGKNVEQQLIKYLDYYYSTGRYNVKIARSVEEAKAMTPMELPDLREMQENLMKCFPYDLWND